MTLYYITIQVSTANCHNRKVPLAYLPLKEEDCARARFTVSIGGVVFPVTDTGTYAMSSNCTGSAVFADAGETWDLVVVSGGKEIKTTIATPGRVFAGTLTRQTVE
jgi:hypothetical protein